MWRERASSNEFIFIRRGWLREVMLHIYAKKMVQKTKGNSHLVEFYQSSLINSVLRNRDRAASFRVGGLKKNA